MYMYYSPAYHNICLSITLSITPFDHAYPSVQRYDLSVLIPEIMPVFCARPEEYMSLHKTVVALQRRDLRHLLIGQRIFGDGLQVADIVLLNFRLLT